MVVISVYTYGVKIIKKFRWESGFLGGVPWNPPLCTNGSAGYLMQLSVNRELLKEKTCLLLKESQSRFISDFKNFIRRLFHSQICFNMIY